MTKTTRCLLCVALICAIALLLPAVRAQAEGENPTYAYDSATKTLTITPGTSGLIGKEIQNESDYYSKWTKEVEKVIIAGDIRGIGTAERGSYQGSAQGIGRRQCGRNAE